MTTRTTPTARETMDGATLESALQRSIIDEAKLRGWKVAHFYDSRRSDSKGWPDLALCRGGVLLVVELKQEGRYPTADQREWLAALAQVTVVKTAVWRPHDREAFEEALQ